jgi:hypothetical protein
MELEELLPFSLEVSQFQLKPVHSLTTYLPEYHFNIRGLSPSRGDYGVIQCSLVAVTDISGEHTTSIFYLEDEITTFFRNGGKNLQL